MPLKTDKHNFLDRQQDQLLRLLDNRLFKPLDRLTIVLRLLMLIALSLWFGFTAVDLWHSISFNIIHRPIYQLTFAAGDIGSESYILANAIKQVVETHHPNIRLNLLETAGSIENLDRLEAGQAQLVTAQADVDPGPTARSVATLYRDLFQLVVQDQSNFQQFSDLQGKRIGIPRESGQFLSFLEIARHFDLSAEDFIFIGINDAEAIEAFQVDRVDAVFRVRAPGNRTVQQLVQACQARLLPIEQAAAMKINHPAFDAATIPLGAYKGSQPAVPSVDIPTVAVYKILYASKRADRRVIQEIARILQDYRQEIANTIPDNALEIKPLVASISPPSGNVGIPIHPGAIAAYSASKPSFIAKNSDILALLLAFVVPIASWIWELRSRTEQRGKSLSEGYVNDVIKLMDDTQAAVNQTLEDRQKALYQIFDQVAKRLIEEDISQESFRTFNEAYKTAREKLERDIDTNMQRQQALQQQQVTQYIQAVMAMSHPQGATQDQSVAAMDAILQQVLEDLAHHRISQAAFHTFMEVYKAILQRVSR